MTPRTLFVRQGALGDFILTIPVFAALCEEGPVDVACDPRFAPLLHLVPGARIGRVMDAGGEECLWMFGGGAPPRDYDRAVAFSVPMGVLLEATGIRDVRAVSAIPTTPALAHFMAVLGRPAEPPRLTVSDPGPRSICIAPGSGGATKRWPLERWVEVAERLADLPVRWIAGPLESGAGWPVVPERPDLVGTVRIAARSVWLGPDSGPTHLAAAGGARVVAVFGPTDPAVWAPPGAIVVMQDCTTEEVAQRARALWNSLNHPDGGAVSG